MPNDFSIPVEDRSGTIKVRVIDQVTDLVTRELQLPVSVINGQIRSDVNRDILKVAAIDRHSQHGTIFVGLVKGFGMKNGAFASSAAWNTSDIIVIGVNDEDMAGAVNRILDLQGGVVVYEGREVKAELPLPVWGLLSVQPAEFITRKLKEIKRSLNVLGCSFTDPHLTLTTLTCAAIPQLRICEEGLVSLKEGNTVDLIVN